MLFNYNLFNLNNEIKYAASKFYFFLLLLLLLLLHPAVKRRKTGKGKEISHGKMQMSLEAITMLMRFHHRSCCPTSGGIFHPYLGNNCALRIRDTLPRCLQLSQFLFSFLFLLSAWSTASWVIFYWAASETAGYGALFADLPSCNSALFLVVCFCHHRLSITCTDAFVNILLARVFTWGGKRSIDCDCLHQQ